MQNSTSEPRSCTICGTTVTDDDSLPEPLCSRECKLLAAIRAALDCHTHFSQMTITNNDTDFNPGRRAMVVCDQCVDKFESLLEGIPHYDFTEIRAKVINRKRRK